MRVGPPGTTETDRHEPAGLDEVESAIVQTIEALEESSWGEAAASARELSQRWLSFKRPMRAQGGERIWDTIDVDAFDAGVRELERQIAAQRKQAALEEARGLLEIARRYGTPPGRTTGRGLPDAAGPSGFSW